MVDAIKSAAVIILLVIGLGFYPAYRNAENIESNMKQAAHTAMMEYVDQVRSKGYADVSDYQVFLNKLDASQGVFDVRLEYKKKILEPTYSDPNDINTFQGTFTVRYDGYYTKNILSTLYPKNKLPEDDKSRRFPMHVGDLFTVEIQLKHETLADRMRKFLFHGRNQPVIMKYGGMIRSEAP